ncbi:MAG: acyl-CoA thioesterase [Planctomycetaceae bacterium]|nr:acyl-CoA thioesterase [Planctomycetaceae bacterium]
MSEHPSPPELASQAVVVSLPIQWGDQDLFGHVNGVVYFRWFETARVEYLNRSGLSHLMSGEGRGPILASIKCDYRRQLKHPDTVLVSASVREIGRSSMKMHHLIYSVSQQALAAEGESTVVMFDYHAQRPTRVPDDIRQQIERLEGPSGTARKNYR